MALGYRCTLLLIAGFAVLAIAAAAAAFAAGFTGGLTEQLAPPLSTTVRSAFISVEAISVVALLLLGGTLLVLAWFIRQHIREPFESLRRCMNGAAAGDLAVPIWGIERKDELGTLARAAERLRQTAAADADDRFGDVTARLKQGADRLETDLARMALAAQEAQMRVEASSTRAALASQTATEAAGLAKEGAARIVRKAEDAIEAAGLQNRAAMDEFSRAIAQLAGVTSRLDCLDLGGDRSVPSARSQPVPIPIANRVAPTGAPAGDAVLEDLIGDLDALERFASAHKSIASDQALAFTAAVIEAIDRLNVVAERVAAAADDKAVRAAG
jgi:HAMP domain-containing protein